LFVEVDPLADPSPPLAEVVLLVEIAPLAELAPLSEPA